MSDLTLPSLSSAPRPVCRACLRPLRACICRWIRPTANSVELLILQHPMEVSQAKGSARLLHLSLERSRLEVGECFDETALKTWLPSQPGRSWLLYPDTSAMPASAATAMMPAMSEAEAAPSGLPTAPHMDDVLTCDGSAVAEESPLCLVVLDATWRKSFRMLCLNPALQCLPRLPLRDPPPSAYTIRRARHANQRSTLEAACLALQALEQAPAARYAPLLAAFDGFVAERAVWAHG